MGLKTDRERQNRTEQNVLSDFVFCVRSSPRANITLSGKKKRKLLKQLQHMQQEKAGMEGRAAPSITVIDPQPLSQTVTF